MKSQRFCIEQKKKFPAYGPDCWGLTSSHDPFRDYAHQVVANAAAPLKARYPVVASNDDQGFADAVAARGLL